MAECKRLIIWFSSFLGCDNEANFTNPLFLRLGFPEGGRLDASLPGSGTVQGN